MKIGFSKNIITPQTPIHLSGFAGIRMADGVHDDIYVKVILSKDKNVKGLITYDLVGFDEVLYDPLKDMMNELSLNIDDFIVSATHTHSAMCGTCESSKGIHKGGEYIFGKKDEQVISCIVAQTKKSIIEALNSLEETQISISKGQLTGIGTNRNSLEFKGNNDILVVSLTNNKKKVLIVNYACHPTVLNHTNTKISADYPGAFSKLVSLDGYEFAMFLNGSCGDISTRFTKNKSDYEEVERYANILKDKVYQLVNDAKEVKINDIIIKHFKASLKLKKADSVEHAKKQLSQYEEEVINAKKEGLSGAALRLIESRKEGAEANLNYAINHLDQDIYDVHLAIYKINDEYFITVPGELFSELSNPLQNEKVHFINYANGYIGYFANEQAYGDYYYEALSSPFEKGESEKMMDVIKKEIDNI